MKELIDKLWKEQNLEKREWIRLIKGQRDAEYLYEKARAVREQYYGRAVYTRGLIEFTNYCRCDCYYCGIRRSNPKAMRYRLSEEEILSCAKIGYDLGFRTFVLQGGEDGYFTAERICSLVEKIKAGFKDCAVTLSLGERNRADYRAFFDAGADRYLLRHETADKEHYAKLHPKEQTLINRQECLYALKEIGFQVGCGFMLGSPYQTPETLSEDMCFLKELEPDMVGLGPFIPHHDTPFAKERQGSLKETLYMLALVRLMLPKVLLPATTALGTVAGDGREQGILAGANVVMPNLSPVSVRKKYDLYDNKICTGDEAAECRMCLSNRMRRIGYELVVDRGDPKK